MSLEKSTKSIHSLEKALRLIEIMAQATEPMRLMDLAAAADLPASTSLRLLHTLKRNGYVLQEDSTSRYQLSLKLFHIGNQISAGISIKDIARQHLNDLARNTGHSVNLAIPQGDTAVIVEVINGFSEDEIIITKPGRIIPLYCSALGRALLLDYTPEQLRNYWNALSPVSYTPLTITSLSGLQEQLSQAHRRGFVYEPGELRNGIAGVAAPIRSGAQIVASISMAELSSSMTQEMIADFGQKIVQTAKNISLQL